MIFSVVIYVNLVSDTVRYFPVLTDYIRAVVFYKQNITFAAIIYIVYGVLDFKAVDIVKFDDFAFCALGSFFYQNDAADIFYRKDVHNNNESHHYKYSEYYQEIIHYSPPNRSL